MNRIIILAVSFALVGFASFAQEEEHNLQPFGLWLEELKKDALAQGISAKTLEEALADTAPIDRVIELDRTQPESTLTLEEYLEKVVTEARVQQGRELFAEHRELLKKIGGQYGVSPRYILALWGIETNYGGNTGNFSVIDALATLAYDGRRSEFFRDELLKALTIIDQDHIRAIDMDGSWAGAMGQCQFMPSSFLRFAVDYDGDGRRDIWNSPPDIFASIANYLHESGWNGEESNVDKVLLKWNRSQYFVMAVKTLAKRIGE